MCDVLVVNMAEITIQKQWIEGAECRLDGACGGVTRLLLPVSYDRKAT
jgi:hypothetical protein